MFCGGGGGGGDNDSRKVIEFYKKKKIELIINVYWIYIYIFCMKYEVLIILCIWFIK